MKTVSSLLKKYRIRPNKNLGQNFLSDPNLIHKIVDILEIYPDEDVLEIGTGLGVLTYQLAKEALEVISVEKDKRLFQIATKEFGGKENLKLIHADFLKINLSALLKNNHLPLKVVGLIPYSLSSKILFNLLDHHSLFQFAVLTLQKEVAARLTANPGTKDYGILTILMGIDAQCRKLFDVEPGSFIPPPQVTSTVIKIEFFKQSPFLIYDHPLFKKLIKTAFATRRKTIQNALKPLLKNGRVKPWEQAGIDPCLRPEQISIPQYVGLANTLHTLL